VLDHIAKPNIRAHIAGTATINAWRDGIRSLAQHQNAYCKLSGMVTEADWQAWRSDDFTPYIETVLEAFTPSRCMIGSDWPVCALAGAYADVIAIVEKNVGLPTMQTLRETAAAVYIRQ
jgi:L-fuconolactonase